MNDRVFDKRDVLLLDTEEVGHSDIPLVIETLAVVVGVFETATEFVGLMLTVDVFEFVMLVVAVPSAVCVRVLG